MTSEVFQRKAQRIVERLDKIMSLVGPDYDLFVSNELSRDASAFYLVLALEECFDLAEHLIAQKQWGTPDSAGSEFDFLAERQVISRALAKQMREAVGLRNVIVHQYANLDWTLVHRALTDTGRIRDYLLALEPFLG